MRVHHRLRTVLFVLLLVVAASAGGAAAPPAEAGIVTPGGPSWWYQMGGPSAEWDSFSAGVRLPGGSLAAAGVYDRTASANGDILVTRISTRGSVVWVKAWDGPDHLDDLASTIATDEDGNVVVAGYSTSTVGQRDVVVVKWARSGAFLWAGRWDSEAHADEVVTDIAVDARGDVVVCGSAGDETQGLVVKFRGTDGAVRWADAITSSGGAGANRLVVDARRNVYVVGYRTGATTGLDCLVRKYTPAGAKAWTRTWDGADHLKDGGIALCLAPGPTLYVCGQAGTTANQTDVCLLKYSLAGSLRWARTWDGPGHAGDVALAVACDARGDAVVAGRSDSGTPAGDLGLLLRYTSAGRRSWARTFDNSITGGYVRLTSLVVSATGDVWAGGETWAGSTSGALVTRFSPKGTQLWARVWTGPAGAGADINDLVAGGGGLFAAGMVNVAGSDVDAFAGVIAK